MAPPVYNVNQLSEFEFLENFKSFISTEAFRTGCHELFVEIDEPDAKAEQARHPFVHSVISRLDRLDKNAKEKLRTLYNPSEKEFSALILWGAYFSNENNFEFRYLLPEDGPVEYLSVHYCDH